MRVEFLKLPPLPVLPYRHSTRPFAVAFSLGRINVLAVALCLETRRVNVAERLNSFLGLKKFPSHLYFGNTPYTYMGFPEYFGNNNFRAKISQLQLWLCSLQLKMYFGIIEAKGYVKFSFSCNRIFNSVNVLCFANHFPVFTGRSRATLEKG